MLCNRSIVVAMAFSALPLVMAEGSAPPAPYRGAHRVSPPIVMAYGVGKITDAEAARLKDGGWNLVLCPEDALDILQRHGLKAVMRSQLLNPQT